jgi:hypothetical protein
MQLNAHWSAWSEWAQHRDCQIRKRTLKVGDSVIADHTHYRTEAEHLWGKGHFHSLWFLGQQSTRVYRTQRAALRRITDNLAR